MNMDLCGRRRLRGVGSRRVLLPLTGVAWAAAWLVVLSCPCAHALGLYRAGSATVLDQGTGLEWQKSDDSTLRDWQNALGYCENLDLDSKTDWRLPNVRELKSIVENSRYYPVIDPAFSAKSANYWSATSVAGQPAAHAWSVNFSNGDDNWYPKTTKYNVRCVRGGVTLP